MALMASVSPVFQLVWTIPPVAIETNMTCKVFRAMALRSTHGKRDDSMSVEAWTTELSIRELEALELQTQMTDIDLGKA